MKKPLPSLLGLLAYPLLAAPIWAQSNDLLDIPLYENWYQVEMVVFKRAEDGNAKARESWPKNLPLAFPPNVQHLLPPGAEEPTTAEATAELPVTNDAEPTAAYTPFELLGRDQYIIPNVSYALKRERGVAVLFHESWLQPMKPLKDSPALIIRGGETFGEHRELEGSVTLSLSRYLHIQTDLWLTEFVANYGQKSEHWPELPTPPVAIQHGEESTTDLPTLDTNGAGDTGFTLQLNSENNLFGDSEMDTGSRLDDFTSLTEKPFLINEIITMGQKRRMRSEELHYIDHPRMGILIKITPFEQPTPTLNEDSL